MSSTDTIPTLKMKEIPTFLLKLICRPQMNLCGSKAIVMSVTTCTLADVNMTFGRL